MNHTNETKMSKGAYKKDGGKPRMDLLLGGFPNSIDELAKICTMGAQKYDDDGDDGFVRKQNWKNGGMRHLRILAAAMRHINKYLKGIDRDDESNCLHLLHAAWGLMVIAESYKTTPHLDDRDFPWMRDRRIGLDIDGVISDSFPYVLSKLTQEDQWDDMYHYNWHPDALEHWLSISDEDMLEQIKPYRLKSGAELGFEPVAYITARPESMREITEKWLHANNFPTAPVIFTDDKAAACIQMGVQLFVEDKFETFRDLNRAGIPCLLMDQPYNRKYDVGSRRIQSLKEVMEWL